MSTPASTAPEVTPTPAKASPVTSLLPPNFAEAWINFPRRVCRRELPAYSLHAHLLLCAAQSPFAFEDLPDGYQITWEDLWEAVAVVSTPYGQPICYPSAWRCVFVQRLHRLNLASEVKKFRVWQNDYLSAPEVFCTDGDGRELTAPGILARVVFLQRHLHLSLSEVWTMPIGQALWMHAATLEQINDNVSLLEDEEAKLFALVKAIQDGTASPDSLPPRPDEEERGGRLSRAAQILGIDSE